MVLLRGFLRAEVEYPARYKAAQDWDIGYNDGNIVFDVIDAVVDRVGPVRDVDGVEAITVG